MAVPGRVLVDTGSPQMIDMSHVAVADLYLGDVSSQVYEFLLLGPARACSSTPMTSAGRMIRTMPFGSWEKW
jgi:hypothetical protein